MPRLICCLLLLSVISVPVWSQAATTPTPRLLTVTGDAVVSAQPDRAVVRLGIETQDKSLQTAQTENARIMNRVLERVRGLGIPERNIQTSTLSVYPIQEQRDPKRPDLPVTVGYQVTNIVSVTIEDLSLVGRVVDGALGAGANRVEGVFFTIRNETEFRQRALADAAREAREKARVLADAMGVRLGLLHSVSEGGVSIVQPIAARLVAAEAAPTPVLPGQLEIRANVTSAFVIE